MKAVPEMAFGLSSVAWAAVGALATCAIAVLTLGSVIFIAQQLALARRQQAEGVIERGTTSLAAARSDLQELKATVRRDDKLGLDSMKRVRDVFFAYEAYLPIFELSLESKGKSGVASSKWYVDDVDLLLRVLKYLNKQTRDMIDVFAKDVGKVLDGYLTKVEATDEERRRAHALRAEGDFSKVEEFLELLSTAYFLKKGVSVSELMDSSTTRSQKEAGEGFNADLFSSFGGDARNVAELNAWMDEIGDMLDQVGTIIERIGTALGRLS